MAMTKRDQRQKMSDTDSAARTIIAQEAHAREAKTKRLREARLKMESEAPAVEPVVRKKRAKA
jgi:hypothetical protein